jgi:hypothetical protein
MSSAKTAFMSKSRYCNGLQCHKMLWLLDHRKELYDDTVENKYNLNEGNRVGELARQYFKAGIVIPYNPDFSVMVCQTKELLTHGKAVIAEASFSYNDCFCSVDIFSLSEGYVEIIEVKSSTGLKDEYLHDLAYQYYVLSGSGLKIRKASIMHIDNKYSRIGGLNLEKLFSITDCTNEIRKMQELTAENIKRMKKIQTHEPVQDIGFHCNVPHECGFKKYCWKHIPKNSVLDVANLRSSKKFEYYRQGIISFEQVLSGGIPLNEKQSLQVRSEVEKLPPTINRVEICKFLDTLNYPLYLLDFETFKTAIPPFDNARPFVQIPFQYSLHIIEHEGGFPIHKEFLAQEGTDPRSTLAENLCSDIPREVCVVSYNMSFEKGRIAELAELFPDLSDHLMGICDSMRDLMRPFQTHAYYRREFNGSYSIKVILPALYPDDPELDYNNLETIRNAGDAMDAFPYLHEKLPEEIVEIRKALLAYCRLDTFGMVKILEFLYTAKKEIDLKKHKIRCGNGWKIYPANLFSGMADDWDPYCCGTCKRNTANVCDYDFERDGHLCPREIDSGNVSYEADAYLN